MLYYRIYSVYCYIPPIYSSIIYSFYQSQYLLTVDPVPSSIQLFIAPLLIFPIHYPLRFAQSLIHFQD